MDVIVLAAGMGTRLGKIGKDTPKSLLPLGRGCVLDEVITGAWVEGVNAVRVVHNDLHAGKPESWARKFKQWKKNTHWELSPGQRRDRPYIRLINDGVRHPKDRLGAVGDLAAALRNEAAFVVCGDDLFRDSREEMLGFDGKTSAIAVRSANDLNSLVLSGNPSQVLVNAGEVAEIGKSVDGTPWRYCGSMYLAKDDVMFVLEYVETMRRAGIVPDALDGLIDAMVEDGRKVRAVKFKTPFWSIGSDRLYEAVKRRMMRREPAAGGASR